MLVRYSDWKTGIKVKILELNSLQNKTTDTVSNCVADCILKDDFKGKVIRLCADNTKSNFDEVNRKRLNNVFTKLKQKLSHRLIRVACVCHIFHNTLEQLPIFYR